MVDLLPHSDVSETSECFLSPGRQAILLSDCRELKPTGSIGTAFSRLLCVFLESLDIHDSPNDVSTVDEPDTAPATPATPTQGLSYVGSMITNANRSFVCKTLFLHISDAYTLCWTTENVACASSKLKSPRDSADTIVPSPIEHIPLGTSRRHPRL